MPDAEPILSNIAGSFAWSVLHDRHPALIEQVRQNSPFGPAQHAALDRLLAQVRDGVIEPLPPGEHDEGARAAWLRRSHPYLGRSWYDVPFLWAESYFYARLLGATGFFAPGPWHGVDPFEPMKAAQLTAMAADDGLAAALDLDDAQALLLASVWGNQADLGFQLQAGTGGQPLTSGLMSGLIADDSHRIWSALSGQTSGVVAFVADNAGRELRADLLLIDHLLANDLAAQVILHVKPYPYYVSDAVTADVVAVLRVLGSGAGPEQEAAQRLRSALASGTLSLVTHEFYCTPETFAQMPADLAAQFADCELTILKGDLNYRRLVGDDRWPPLTPFAELAGHFPGPVAVLRTLKCDVIAGLDEDTLHGLDATGEAWRTSGTHAVIQARL